MVQLNGAMQNLFTEKQATKAQVGIAVVHCCGHVMKKREIRISDEG
jgi:hypothetical protein